eukprot:405234_1
MINGNMSQLQGNQNVTRTIPPIPFTQEQMQQFTIQPLLRQFQSTNTPQYGNTAQYTTAQQYTPHQQYTTPEHKSYNIPGLTPMGSGITLTLMADEVEDLSEEDKQLWRLLIRRFGFHKASLLTLNLKQYKCFDGTHEIIQIPSEKKPNEQNNDCNKEVDILHHTKKGSIPPSIQNESKQLVSKASKTITSKPNSIKDTSFDDEEFQRIFRKMIFEKTITYEKLGITEKKAMKFQNVLYYNGYCGLGKNYNIETNKGRRYASITKLYSKKDGKYKELEKTDEMDETIFTYYCKFSNEYNETKEKNTNKILEKESKSENDKNQDDKQQEHIDTDNNNNSQKRKDSLCNNAEPPNKKRK